MTKERHILFMEEKNKNKLVYSKRYVIRNVDIEGGHIYDDNNYQVRYSLGLVYSKLGKSDEAVEQYKISIKMNPDFKSSIFNLASVFEAEGDKRQAVEYYRRTLESKEKDREMDLFVLEKLVRIYNEFGEKDKAEEYNKKLIEMGG